MTTHRTLADCLPSVHPGEVLQAEFLTPLGISAYRLAKDLEVPITRIHEIIHGRRAITADTALRLAHYFGATARFWLNLQTHYDLERAEEALGDQLAHLPSHALGAMADSTSH